MRQNEMRRYKVLFLCVHNSARSQMAEAWLNHLHGDVFEAHSAGFEPRGLNPLAVQVMKEVGIDISQKKPKSVFDLVKAGRLFSYVITVCDEAIEEMCPIFPGITNRLHWGFPDPSALTGTREERLEKVRNIRDAIKSSIEKWYEQLHSGQEV